MAAGGSHEPNLTPFIDLFSVLICFLLMSTAWISLEVLPSNIEKATSSDTQASSQPLPPDNQKVSLSIDMRIDEVILNEGKDILRISNSAGAIDTAGIKRMLEIWKEKYPAKSDVVLNTEAKVRYGDMIKIYDLLVGANFPEVGINPQ